MKPSSELALRAAPADATGAIAPEGVPQPAIARLRSKGINRFIATLRSDSVVEQGLTNHYQTLTKY
jgi:hypothetical protein